MSQLTTATPSIALGTQAGRLVNASPDLVRFGALMLQLVLLMAVFAVFRVEESGFMRLAAILVGAFAVHYWLPFRYKEPFWIGVSLAGSALLVTPMVAGLVLASGLFIYGVLASPLAYRWRLAIVLAFVAGIVALRSMAGVTIPGQFWPVFGAIFMFRLAIYLYDVRFAKTRPSLQEFLAYFFSLPNYYFLLFPVIDLQTQRRTYFQRDINLIAQQGIDWMLRGAVQLALYRLIYHLKPSFTPEQVTTFPSLVLGMVAVYMLYLRVSGQFHLIVGILHLFGYDLPETHRKYLLASSLTDFWRRINIYWKDFMVKMVYFPMFFRFRKSGETRAQVLATIAVFVVTWATHSYQWWWLRGEILLTWPDTLFWAILGACVVVNVVIENRRRQKGPAVQPTRLRQALDTAVTFSFIVVLWSLWNSPSVGEWLDVVTWWQIG